MYIKKVMEKITNRNKKVMIMIQYTACPYFTKKIHINLYFQTSTNARRQQTTVDSSARI